MDSVNNQSASVSKESRNKIRVDYEGKLSFGQRMKSKFKSSQTWIKIVVNIFRFILMLGVSYVIIYPFISKIASSFMSINDVRDSTVLLIAREPNLEQYQTLFTEAGYMEAFINTLTLSLICALIQMFVSCLIGYGLAKFKFKGNTLIFVLVLLTMIIPHRTLSFYLKRSFTSFDLFSFATFGWDGIIEHITGSTLALNNTYIPFVIMSVCGLAFKNGLYIYLMRQFFKGIPDELEESAYVDGSGTIRTFFQIILPLAVPMMITVFLFAFSWQWTDNFYAGNIFITAVGVGSQSSSSIDIPVLMSDVIGFANSTAAVDFVGKVNEYKTAVQGTAGIMVIAPLVVLYLFCQKYLVQGIERSGITG